MSDSQYSIKCASEWGVTWERNNWMTASREPVKNQDLVKAILGRIQDKERFGGTVSFKWVKGHDKSYGNNAADRLANAGARLTS